MPKRIYRVEWYLKPTEEWFIRHLNTKNDADTYADDIHTLLKQLGDEHPSVEITTVDLSA